MTDTTPYGQPPDEQPFRLESKLPKLDGYICLDCHGKAVSYTPPNFDSSTGPYLKCESCGFFAEFYKFQHRDAVVSPLGSSDASILLKLVLRRGGLMEKVIPYHLQFQNHSVKYYS